MKKSASLAHHQKLDTTKHVAPVSNPLHRYVSSNVNSGRTSVRQTTSNSHNQSIIQTTVDVPVVPTRKTEVVKRTTASANERPGSSKAYETAAIIKTNHGEKKNSVDPPVNKQMAPKVSGPFG